MIEYNGLGYDLKDSYARKLLHDITDKRMGNKEELHRIITSQNEQGLSNYFNTFEYTNLDNATISNRGGLKVGDKNLSFIIPNGYGDGITIYRVLENDEPVDARLQFYNTIESDLLYIFANDCKDIVKEVLHGDYAVYYGDGKVQFKKL